MYKIISQENVRISEKGNPDLMVTLGTITTAGKPPALPSGFLCLPGSAGPSSYQPTLCKAVWVERCILERGTGFSQHLQRALYSYNESLPGGSAGAWSRLRPRAGGFGSERHGLGYLWCQHRICQFLLQMLISPVSAFASPKPLALAETTASLSLLGPFFFSG